MSLSNSEENMPALGNTGWRLFFEIQLSHANKSDMYQISFEVFNL